MKKTFRSAIFSNLLVLLLVTGAACKMDNPFAELESSEFLTDTQRQLDTTTEWYIDYGQTTTYADYVQIGAVTAAQAGTTAGLDIDYVDYIYRLSITNLIPNGDFESALSADWVDVGGATSSTVGDPGHTNIASVDFFQGDVLSFNTIQPSTDRIELDLDIVSYDTLITGAFYLIRYDFSSISPGTKYFQMQGLGDQGIWTPNIDLENTVYSLPADFTVPGLETQFWSETTNIFTIGTTEVGGSAMSGYMDNLRMLRTDIENRIVLEVPWSTEGTRPDLVSGHYRFSVYIKNIPLSELPANEFQSKSVTLGISTTFGGLNSIYNQAVHQSDDPGANWDEWTQISVDSFLQVDEPATDPTDTVIFLCITPTNKQSATFKDVGSVLIAAPSLHYSSDGTF